MSSLSITTIQSNIFWKDKALNLNMFEKKILDFSEPTEIFILPEMFNTGFVTDPIGMDENMQGPTISWMRSLAKSKNAIITGSLIIKEDNKYFNRIIWMLPNGQYGQYDKRHLFSYGKEHINFTPGKNRFIASVKGWKIQLQICYDLRFPVWTRQNMQKRDPEFDVIINVANWPKQRANAWVTLLKARAIENMCYMIGVNRTGIDGEHIAYCGLSSVIDPLGNILYQKEDEDQLHNIQLKKENLQSIRDQFSFLNDADDFHILC